ncbi:hypothetical protein ACF3NR_07955 [Vaginella massiliensis]|uniref:hypothetical protein n=1 Tax=Vaginella massiliensis TaxID=1816680 RepID=UPI003750DFCE
MKTIGKVILVLGFAIGSVSLKAQHNDHGKNVLERMKKELRLTDDQVSKIQAVHDSYANDKMELRKRMDDIRAKEKAEIKKILTDEQLKKLKALKEKNRTVKPR